MHPASSEWDFLRVHLKRLMRGCAGKMLLSGPIVQALALQMCAVLLAGCCFQRRAAVGRGSVRVGGTNGRLRSAQPVATAPRAGEKAKGLLKACLPAVCPAPCEGGEDAGIAR